MKIHSIIILVSLMTLTSCSVFEQTPEDVRHKLSNPGSGQLYEPAPLQTP
jgi:hypothetical protein